MISAKFKHILLKNTVCNNTIQYSHIIQSRFICKRCTWVNSWLAAASKLHTSSGMSSTLRILLRDFRVSRLWSAWTRNCFVSSVVKRCRKERGVREVWQRFRQNVFLPRRTLLLSAAAAYKSRDEEPSSCDNNITDEELQALIADIDAVEELSQKTLYCQGCGKRALVNKKQPRVVYCQCSNASLPESNEDGWEPYMEAEDVIIWRKEYKPQQGLYAYKVYGRYKDITAQTFAAVQVDGVYRRVWDNAVAAMSIVEREANGVKDQAVLHWEVLWPRLFANRDYVYIRRHKQFQVKTKCLTHKDKIFDTTKEDPCADEKKPQQNFANDGKNSQEATDNAKVCKSEDEYSDIFGFYTQAKEKPVNNIENNSEIRKEKIEGERELKDNKVYVIVSRSCQHNNVPETKNAIRVLEYWSHMVIRTLDGDDNPGMEFVLTYYDEPAVGGLPAGVAAWATGRAAPAYLHRMHAAAHSYTQWREHAKIQDEPDFTPFGPEKLTYKDKKLNALRRREQDMESSKQGPELSASDTKDESTQTEEPKAPDGKQVEVQTNKRGVVKDSQGTALKKESTSSSEGDSDKPEEEENGGWWRYLYPFYYFL